MGQTPEALAEGAPSKKPRQLTTLHKELKEAIERGDYDKVKECADSGSIDWRKQHYRKSWAQRAFKVRTTDSERITELLVERARAAGVDVERPAPARRPRHLGEARGEGPARRQGGAGGSRASAPAPEGQGAARGGAVARRGGIKELSLKNMLKYAIDKGEVADVKRLLAARNWDLSEKHYGRDWVERAYAARCREEADKNEIIKCIVSRAGPTCSVPHDYRYMQLKTAIDEGNVHEVRRLLEEHVVWDWGKKWYGKTLVERAAKAMSTDGKERVLQLLLDASGQDRPAKKSKTPNSLTDAHPSGKRPRGGARVKSRDVLTGEATKSQNQELKLAIEHGDLAAVNVLVGRYVWNWTARHYGQNWLERAYTSKPSPNKGEIIKVIHSDALRSGATEYPLPPGFVLAAFSEPASASNRARRGGRSRIARTSPQAQEMKLALEVADVDKVKELLSANEWDFSAVFYGHTWIERAMAIRPKPVKEGARPTIGEFQQAKEAILCAVFEAAFRSGRPETGLVRDESSWAEN